MTSPSAASTRIHRVGTLVIGAGVIGSSVAMHLAQKGVSDVRVVDFDLEGSLSSSELNAGGVRATFVQPINIQMSKATIDYFDTIASEIGYRACGYLWLRSAEQMETSLKSRERWQQYGWPSEVLDIAGLQQRVPFIDKTEGMVGAVFAPRDGLVNPNLLKNHFRAQAKAAGAVLDDRVLVRSAEYGSTGVRVIAERFPDVLSSEEKTAVLTDARHERFTTVEYRAERVINCAGAWAPAIARALGYPCPSYPSRRQAMIFDCRDVDLTHYGMIVDTSGVYFHPEASNGLAGFAIPGEPQGINYAYDGESFFMEHIWPALYERSSAFERLKHLTGWAGQYEVSPDECAILGRVESGEAGKSGRIFEAHSFSGHGVMHSYSAGLALAELLAKGRYETLDASVLSGSRFETGKLVHENAVI